MSMSRTIRRGNTTRLSAVKTASGERKPSLGKYSRRRQNIARKAMATARAVVAGLIRAAGGDMPFVAVVEQGCRYKNTLAERGTTISVATKVEP